MLILGATRAPVNPANQDMQNLTQGGIVPFESLRAVSMVARSIRRLADDPERKAKGRTAAICDILPQERKEHGRRTTQRGKKGKVLEGNQTSVRRFLPMRRRRLMILRPPRQLMRARKPWVLARFRLLFRIFVLITQPRRCPYPSASYQIERSAASEKGRKQR